MEAALKIAIAEAKEAKAAKGQNAALQGDTDQGGYIDELMTVLMNDAQLCVMEGDDTDDLDKDATPEAAPSSAPPASESQDLRATAVALMAEVADLRATARTIRIGELKNEE